MATANSPVRIAGSSGACVRPVYKNELHASKALQAMDKMRGQNLFCNVTLVAGTMEIVAHKLVLAAYSAYFYALFVDFGDDNQQRVVIEGVDAQSLDAIVKYAYTACVEITEENVQQLLSAADFLQVTDVREACCDFLQAQLHPTNCLGISAFAHLHGCTNLAIAADIYAAEHFSEMSVEDEILSLTPVQLVGLLANDRLANTNQETIFECAVRWVRAGSEGEDRSVHFFQLMQRVDLALLPQDYLLNRVKKEPLVKTDLRCSQLLIEALTHHLRSKEGQASALAQSQILLAVGDYSSEYYDFQQERWQRAANMQTRRCNTGLAVLDGRAFVIGGQTNNLYTNTVEVYDAATNSWSQRSPMRTCRAFHGVAVLGVCVYAIGGRDGSISLATVEKCDIRHGASSQWTEVASMRTRRSAVGAGVLNGMLYAVGGHDGSRPLRSVECYSPASNRWEDAPNMTVRRQGVSVGVLNGELYAVGGWNGSERRLKTVEAYCPRRRTWRRVKDMAVSRWYAGVVTYEGCMYVVGGEFEKSVEVYRHVDYVGCRNVRRAGYSVCRSFTQISINTC